MDGANEETIGVPIFTGELINFDNSGEKTNETEAKCSNSDDISLCERLASHLNISVKSVRTKRFIAENNGNFRLSKNLTTGNFNNSKASRNAFDHLKEVFLEIQEGLGLDVDKTNIVSVPKHWEIHNDLVLFPANSFNTIFTEQLLSKNLESARKQLCHAICDILSVQRIAMKNPGGILNDDFRSPSVTLLHGFKSKETPNEPEILFTWAQRTENGIIQTWDITQCMFSVGNISEKIRVANFNCENEIVVDLFAGIGYFVLPYLVHAKAEHVYACEWNPSSVKALKRNLDLNHIPESKYSILEGDNRMVCPRNIAHRVNLGLIPSAEGSYKTAVEALNGNFGGVLHIHGNVRREKPKKASRIHALPNNLLVQSDTCENSEKSDIDPSLTNFVVYPENEKLIFDTYPNVSDCKYSEWKSWASETARKIGCFLIKKDECCRWKLTLIHLEHVKAFAPFVDHLVLDLQCTPIP